MEHPDLDSITDFDEWCKELAYRMNHYAFGALYYESNPDKALKRVLAGLDRGIKDACRQEVAHRAQTSNREAWVSIQTVGDTCKYCTSRAGTWYAAGGGFADAFHGFHSHCDCHVAVSFDKGKNIEYRYRSDDAGKELSEYVDAYGAKRSGGLYGAWNDDNDPKMEKRYKHAEMFYESVRARNRVAEIEAVSKNSNIDKKIVANAYNHIFLEEHELNGVTKRFDADYDMAQSWQRLRSGKNIQEHDVILLMHENSEANYMKSGMSYEEAHEKAHEAGYNYSKALEKWKAKRGK